MITNNEIYVIFFTLLASTAILWLVWLLIKAKQFTKFKIQIENELKPKVIDYIINNLNESRDELHPNTDTHQQATILYWTQYKSRTLQAALAWEIIDKQWLKETGNIRNSQHLFHLEKRHLHNI